MLVSQSPDLLRGAAGKWKGGGSVKTKIAEALDRPWQSAIIQVSSQAAKNTSTGPDMARAGSLPVRQELRSQGQLDTLWEGEWTVKDRIFTLGGCDLPRADSLPMRQELHNWGQADNLVEARSSPTTELRHQRGTTGTDTRSRSSQMRLTDEALRQAEAPGTEGKRRGGGGGGGGEGGRSAFTALQ